MTTKKAIVGWNYHVKEYHTIARQYYQIWNFHGRPTQGKIYEDMIHSKKVFKNKIKWCQLNEIKIKMDLIATHRYNKDFSNFWKETNKLNYKSSLPISVNGNQNPISIANMFISKFNPTPTPTLDPAVELVESQVENPSERCLGRGGAETERHAPITLGPPCSPPAPNGLDELHVTADDVFRCVKNMKRGKSPGHDGLSVEHILYGPALLYDKIALLYNTCIDHSYLPEDFMKTIVVPIVKNRTGDVSNLSNYRPISLATVFSKIFETLLMKHLNEKNIALHNAQFGFRRGLSTDLAVFALKNTVYEYVKRNTTVYSCFLDLSRAFDSINYNLLWNKLRTTQVPSKIVDLFKFWYDNQTNQVKWDNALSEKYKLTSGVRQGGLTSPILFNLYVNDLIEELSSTRAGCRIGGECLNNLSYADDMVLLSPSVNGLRKLISVCENYAAQHQLTYNVNKTQVMIFKHGKGPDCVLPITLCGTELQIVNKFKYLGHILTENLNDDDDLERQRRSIACRSNMLARRFRHCSKQVKITLFKSYCQSLYTSHLWYKYTKSAYNTLRVQYNNAFRAMLNLPWRCSATDMFEEGRVADFYAIMRNLRASFSKRLLNNSNGIVCAVFRYVYVLRRTN